ARGHDACAWAGPGGPSRARVKRLIWRRDRVVVGPRGTRGVRRRPFDGAPFVRVWAGRNGGGRPSRTGSACTVKRRSATARAVRWDLRQQPPDIRSADAPQTQRRNRRAVVCAAKRAEAEPCGSADLTAPQSTPKLVTR